ncbi:MAG: class I SAM-dependent methyltransferase [Ignavibacteria bacterium]|jgi:O-methyltransferase involved in polyketide biosynthesis
MDNTKIKLEPTAALVMKWGRNAFKNKTPQKFIEHLDLSSGSELYDKCNEICEWYEEVIINRKYFINDFIKSEISKNDKEYLIINLAAGKSPLALEVLEENHKRIDKVLEIDVAGMDEKKELYDKFFPEYSEKIKCITADITSSSILSLLNSLLHEYYNNHNCIIVLEGVTYYLNKRDFERIISSFRSPYKNNLIVVEYMVPEDSLCEQRKNIPVEIFEIIKNYSELDEIVTYSIDDLSAIFESNDAELKIMNNMIQIEKYRKGKNKYFRNTDEGWIECAVWRI